MIGIGSITRLPRKSLLALAIGAIALAAAAGGTIRHADAASTYNIAVTFDHVTWSSIDDGLFDSTAEVYGHIDASTSGATNGFATRTLAVNGTTSCTTGWSGGSALCNKSVSEGTAYFFSDTLLSSSTAYRPPASSYAFNNNTMVLSVTAGNPINLFMILHDYDSASADDIMCREEANVSFSDAQLQTLNTNMSLKANDALYPSDGKCVTIVNLRRI
jgi:hypothetical protein